MPKNKYTAMKKDKSNDGTDKRKMSKLEKENARLKAQNEQLESDNKRLRSDLGKASKKKDVRTVTLTKEQQQLLLKLLNGTLTPDS